MKALLVYPEFPDTFWSFKHALKFIGKKSSSPPLGLLTVAAMLPDKWDLKLVDMNTAELKHEHLIWADMVFISAMVVQRSSAVEVIQRCVKAQRKVVAGGPLFTSEYQNFKGVDHFILNEAEITLPQFLTDLNSGEPKPIYRTSEYANLALTPTPRWDLVDIQAYDSLSIQLTRGCPFNCEFCNITALLGHKVRFKSTAQILAELDTMAALGWKRNVFFVDDNFIGNKRFLKGDLLPALIEWRKQKQTQGFQFITEASINLADDDELMRMMTAAGFKSVFVGIETPDELGLAECHKTQNIHRSLIGSVKKLQRFGLQVMGGFIVGFDSDTPAIFQKQIDFIQKSGIVTAMVGLLQAPYGTQLYRRMQAEGRLNEEMTGDNTDGSTNIIPRMDMDILKQGYESILNQIYSPSLFYERVKNFLVEYRPPVQPVNMNIEEIKAFFRSIYWIGIRGIERREYWRLFFRALFRDIKKFPLAITFAIYGFHFRKVSELNRL